MSEDEALDPVGLTEVPPEQLALHQVGVYRIEPTGEEERMQMYGAAPMAYYVRYLRVPGVTWLSCSSRSRNTGGRGCVRRLCRSTVPVVTKDTQRNQRDC